MKLKVGSQAFVLDVQNQLVKQGIVIAENKQKTIDKVHVTYDIKFDDNKVESFIDDLINVQIFDSIKRLRQIMIINATQAIDDLISHIKITTKPLVEKTNISNDKVVVKSDVQIIQQKDNNNIIENIQQESKTKKVKIRVGDELIETEVAINDLT